MEEKEPLLSGNVQVNYVESLPIPESDHYSRVIYTPCTSTGDKNDRKEDIKVYKRRFYILFLYSMSTLCQALVWNTWGPISQSAKRVFGWTNGDIALLANWGPIAIILAIVPMSWVMDVKGLRWSCVIASGLTALGAGLRCITTQQPWASWLIHSGQLINGLSGPVAMAACTLVSATWFPPEERTTSTSIGALFNAVGVAVSFVIGPLLVPQQNPDCPQNNKTVSIGRPVYCVNVTNSSGSELEIEREDILRLQYIECGMCAAVFLAILLYFPSKPPHPPSATALLRRVEYKKGILAILRHRQFWIISSVYGISAGVINCWMSILDDDLDPIGISQDSAGWMGFYSIIAGTVGGFLVARCADIFSKHMKFILLLLFSLDAAVFAWLALIATRIVTVSKVHVWWTVISGNGLLTSSIPIIYELSCEVTFPISEGIASNALATYNSVMGGIFLLIAMIPNIGVSWTNWCVMGSVTVCIPLLLFMKDNYNRLNIDIEIGPPDKETTDSLKSQHA